MINLFFPLFSSFKNSKLILFYSGVNTYNIEGIGLPSRMIERLLFCCLDVFRHLIGDLLLLTRDASCQFSLISVMYL